MNYLLESTVCITTFYGLYYLIFRRLTFIRLNRFYLLSSLVVGLLLPLVSYQIQEVVKIPAKVEYEETNLVPFVKNSSTPLISNIPTEETFDWNVILPGIFVLGILFMMIKFSIIIYKLLEISRMSSGNDFISTKSKYANSSFFNLIFIDDSNLSDNEIKQILEHEKWYIRLFHSYDLLFVEILKIVFWFNPILWLYQRSLSEIHEFEVDTRMIQVYNPQAYAHLLLKLASPRTQSATHQFSRKPLTDRIHFLFTKQKSVPMKRLAYLSVLPILGAFFMAFSVEKVVDYQVVEESSKYFRIVRGEKITFKETDMSKVAVMGLKKEEINFFIGFNRLSLEAIDEAQKYFKNYGFTLRVVYLKVSEKGKLVNIEINLLEDDIEKKQSNREKNYEMSNDGGRFDLEDFKKLSKDDKGLCLSIRASKKTGQHSVTLADISPTPPIPPKAPEPPIAPPLPPKLSLPPKPPLVPKLGLFKNIASDSVKLIGEGQLGKNPLVIINGKKYPSSTLYKLNPDNIHGTALYRKNNPKPILKELGEYNIDGALILETKNEKELFLAGKELQISIDNENKRQEVKKTKPIVSRVTLTNIDGEKYDEVTVYRENGSKSASVNVEIGGKVLFLVKGEPKTESELKKLNPNTFGNSVWASEGVNHYYKKKFPKIGKNTVATIAFND